VLGVTIKTTAETIYQANDRFGSSNRPGWRPSREWLGCAKSAIWQG